MENPRAEDVGLESKQSFRDVVDVLVQVVKIMDARNDHGFGSEPHDTKTATGNEDGISHSPEYGVSGADAGVAGVGTWGGADVGLEALRRDVRRMQV